MNGCGNFLLSLIPFFTCVCFVVIIIIIIIIIISCVVICFHIFFVVFVSCFFVWLGDVVWILCSQFLCIE
jgi:hypothetical protein